MSDKAKTHNKTMTITASPEEYEMIVDSIRMAAHVYSSNKAAPANSGKTPVNYFHALLLLAMQLEDARDKK